jgi:hypothetical protein
MKFLEKNLEDIIFETDNSRLNERGFVIFGRKYRQVRLGDAGVCDIITIVYSKKTKKHHITIYELKKDNVNIDTYFQALRYANELENLILKRGLNIDNIKIQIMLCGQQVYGDKNLINILNFYRDHVACFSYYYDFDGLQFNLYTPDKFKLLF